MSSHNEVTGSPFAMSAVSSPALPAPRADVHEVIVALGNAILRTATDRDLAVVFEQEVQRLLSMRAVRLREIPARYQVRLVTPTRTADSIVLDVPTADPRTQAVLEASCDPDRPLDDGGYESLLAAAQLGGLVLEAARGRGAVGATAPDGAAPLVGSTPGMQQLRARVERVALTDFTVLVEGEISR